MIQEPVITDESTNQQYIEVVEDEQYLFSEDRIINPVTKETQRFEKLMIYDSYTWDEKISACKTFGYTAKQVDKWITSGDEIPLMLECLFEISN